MSPPVAFRIVTSPPSWAEAVFHVLAHLRIEGTPSSLFSPWYVRFVEAALGSPAQRDLAEDLSALARLRLNHQQLASLQTLAWLWCTQADARASAHRELAELGRDELAEPALLEQLRPQTEAAEILRCAALLELDACARLPAPNLELDALREELERLSACAPGLRDAVITPIRPLTRHGRVRGPHIWIGVPGSGVSLGHAALQAAHEASVREVLAKKSALAERELEAVALVLLSERIEGTSHAEAHAAWCAHWQVRAEHLTRARLSSAQGRLLDTCLDG